MKVTVTKVGRQAGVLFLVVIAGIFIPLLLWVALVTALQLIFAEWRTTRPQLLAGNLTCSIDANCPSGFRCIDGRCLPGYSY